LIVVSDPQNLDYADPLTNRLENLDKKHRRARSRQRAIGYIGVAVYAGLAILCTFIFFLMADSSLATHLEILGCDAVLIWRGWAAFKYAEIRGSA
jgi:hypothetical protein